MLTPRSESEVLSLAACCELSENSRLGFATKVSRQQPGLLLVNSQSTLGMHVSLRETRGGSRVQTWNRYAYVANNSLSNIDPLGLDGQCDAQGNCKVTVSAPAPADPPSWMWLAFEGWPGTGSAQSFFCMLMGGCNFGNTSSGGGGGGGTVTQPQPQPKPSPVLNQVLGMRAPGQSWPNCMSANANTYSIGGSLELGANAATGTSTSYSSNPLVSAVTGNSVNTFLFGSGSDAAAGMATNAPALVGTAMGSATTFGRRTSSIMSLNLAGVPGGPAVALSQASGGVRAVFGKVGSALSLGMSFATRTAIDIGFTGAEAINCAIPNQ